MLLSRMIRVVEIDIQRIIEDSDSFLERNAMLFEISRCLFIIPLPRHDA